MQSSGRGIGRREGGEKREERGEGEDRLTCRTGWDELRRPYTVSNPASL